MKSPVLDDLDGVKLQADQLPSQRVFVVLVISAPGVVEDVRVYKAVSGDAARAVEGALRGHPCRPALLFGVPIPVIFYSAFDISRGILRVFRPQPDRARA